MAKTSILGGRVVKVANRSGFDKSRLNLLTTGVGTITPIAKQLVIPSSGKLSVKIHAELPPLATDAYLRTHLKVEAFYVPLRICYGGFQSFFAGESIITPGGGFDTALLPNMMVVDYLRHQGDSYLYNHNDDDVWLRFGPSTMTDYFDVKLQKLNDGSVAIGSDRMQAGVDGDVYGLTLNPFPYIAYHLIYDHFYRNKSVSRPAFAPSFEDNNPNFVYRAGSLPFNAFQSPVTVVDFEQIIDGSPLSNEVSTSLNTSLLSSELYDGHSLFDLRQRNFGDDYFTAARPSAQSGNPVTVQVDQNGRFTIASLRLQNALQEFAEVNNYATPDYIQAVASRYGVSPSSAIVQKPVLLGSADFPMFTKGVELTNNQDAASTAYGTIRNPFANEGILGSTAGRAYANGSDFVCDWDVKEPGYIMVMATLVPEANYATGIAKDMRYFTSLGSLVDLPCSLLEGVGDEPIMQRETSALSSPSAVFGYVQRYLWHKVGALNSVHGLFRKGESLQAFAPQRNISNGSTISSAFLEIPKSALDDVAAVSNGVSSYGVMMDCAIEMFVSEPLSESALPSLVDPAREHGKSVYLNNGGSKFD